MLKNTFDPQYTIWSGQRLILLMCQNKCNVLVGQIGAQLHQFSAGATYTKPPMYLSPIDIL